MKAVVRELCQSPSTSIVSPLSRSTICNAPVSVIHPAHQPSEVKLTTGCQAEAGRGRV